MTHAIRQNRSLEAPVPFSITCVTAILEEGIPSRTPHF